MTDDLKARIDSLSGSTVAAKLRAVMPDIDRKVRDGVRHEEIIEALEAAGLSVNLNTFRSYLYRYRRKHGADARTAPPERSFHRPDGNPAGETIGEAETPAPASDDQFEALLKAENRDALGEKYLARRPNLLGKNRSGKR
ncbi:MAG: hypothetical protein PHT60_15490 [Acidiphilium sp.]|nr:hypothetical protein [Acidiphilium sp.]MDD4937166.1 hypothetical protein [Acidiphilium sp.]